MNDFAYFLPIYVDEIISIVSKRKWVVHNFNLDNDDQLYNPSNYLHNSEFSGTKYTVVLDLNLYQFLLNIIKKDIPISKYRDAAALLVFCQMTNIEIDPTFSVYEKVNYDSSNLQEAVADLEFFHKLNNSEINSLAEYALGFSDNVSLNNSIKINHKEVGKNLVQYKKLKEWDSLYLMMLSIIDIKTDKSIPNDLKFQTFLDWSVHDFRMSLVAIIYAVVLFGRYPIKRMMKFKGSQNKEQKQKALHNMTWDLYLMKQFFHKWTSKEDEQEYFFASDDKAFCSLLREAIEVQKHESFEPIKSHLNKSGYDSAMELFNLDLKKVDRMYNSPEWGADYRLSLIEKYEKVLLY